MKTQLLLSILFLSAMLLISTRTSSVNMHKMPGNYSLIITSPNAENLNGQINPEFTMKQTSISSDDVAQNMTDFSAEDENHFLHFHFSRVKTSRRFYKLKMIAYKLMLSFMHIVMLVASFSHIIWH